MSTNWHTSSQGPKKKSIKITKRRIDPCPAHTARNKGSFTTMVLWTAQGFLSSTVYVFPLFICRVNSLNRPVVWLTGPSAVVVRNDFFPHSLPKCLGHDPEGIEPETSKKDA